MSFNLELFNILNTAELIIHIWWSANHVRSCGNCRIKVYLESCIELIKARWMLEWGSFEEIKSKIVANDKSFVNDLKNFPIADKQYLTEFINEI